jgi:hypothetical protein
MNVLRTGFGLEVVTLEPSYALRSHPTFLFEGVVVLEPSSDINVDLGTAKHNKTVINSPSYVGFNWL